MSLSFTQINASLCSPTATPYSLRAMSAAAGKATPDQVSEFIGYSCPAAEVYELNISCNSYQEPFAACSDGGFCIAYTTAQTPVLGIVFYKNSQLTQLYDFSEYTGGQFIKVNSWDSVTGEWSCSIDPSTASVNAPPQQCNIF